MHFLCGPHTIAMRGTYATYVRMGGSNIQNVTGRPEKKMMLLKRMITIMKIR